MCLLVIMVTQLMPLVWYYGYLYIIMLTQFMHALNKIGPSMGDWMYGQEKRNSKRAVVALENGRKKAEAYMSKEHGDYYIRWPLKVLWYCQENKVMGFQLIISTTNSNVPHYIIFVRSCNNMS